MLEETKKLLKMVEDLETRRSGKAPVQKTQEPKPQETEEEKLIVELEKKYDAQLFNRKLKMKEASEKINSLKVKIEKARTTLSEELFGSDLFWKIQEELEKDETELLAAEGDYAEAEGGEEYRMLTDPDLNENKTMADMSSAGVASLGLNEDEGDEGKPGADSGKVGVANIM